MFIYFCTYFFFPISEIYGHEFSYHLTCLTPFTALFKQTKFASVSLSRCINFKLQSLEVRSIVFYPDLSAKICVRTAKALVRLAIRLTSFPSLHRGGVVYCTIRHVIRHALISTPKVPVILHSVSKELPLRKCIFRHNRDFNTSLRGDSFKRKYDCSRIYLLIQYTILGMRY